MKNHKQESTSDIHSTDSTGSLISKAARLADAGQCEEALAVLARAKHSSIDISNARGVCLMRLGRIDSAVRTFRTFVLQSGCTWMKPELPVICRANFSTALLLANLPGGLCETLSEFAEQDHPSVVRLRNALEDWRKSLSWWQRLSFRLGNAPDVPIPISFVPGEFFDPLTSKVTTPPGMTQPSQQITPQVA